MAFKDIHERMVKSFAVRKHPRHEFSRVIMFEPRCLICFDSVGGRMGFAKRIPVKAGHEFPHFFDFRGVMSFGSGGENKLLTDLFDVLPLLLYEGPSQHVSPARSKAG